MLPDTYSRWFGRIVRISCLLLVGIASWRQGSVWAQEYARPVRVGTISDARIDEVSGMVPITGRPDYFWIHNDSKDAARLFAIRKDGALVAEVDLPGASNTDYEDIATGPGPDRDRTYLFIADTGNSQVLVWEDVADALAGRSADVILGASGPSDTQPEISRNQMFWPAAAIFDGTYLWVGERKFSGRLIRFSPTG